MFNYVFVNFSTVIIICIKNKKKVLNEFKVKYIYVCV